MNFCSFRHPAAPRFESATASQALALAGPGAGRYTTIAPGEELEGKESTLLLRTFWPTHVVALAGQIERAKTILARAAGYANDVGLLAEEIDPKSGELLGNFPQAFSHIGLINAAWAIAEAEPAQSAR